MISVVFPGQGSQKVGMGSDFYNQYEYVKKLFDYADDILGYKISDIILNSGCWPFINQRPYDIIANPSDNPKSIFISTFNSAPISADVSIFVDYLNFIIRF